MQVRSTTQSPNSRLGFGKFQATLDYPNMPSEKRFLVNKFLRDTIGRTVDPEHRTGENASTLTVTDTKNRERYQRGILSALDIKITELPDDELNKNRTTRFTETWDA